MSRILLLFLLIFLPVLAEGASKSNDVAQTPPEMLVSPVDSVKLTCSHSNSDFYMIQWYQKSPRDTALKLIGYVRYDSPSMEGSYAGHFSVTGDGRKESVLHFVKLSLGEDTGVYYCAASEAQCCSSEGAATRTPASFLRAGAGHSVILDCSVPGMNSYTMQWYRQAGDHGTAIEFLIKEYDSRVNNLEVFLDTSANKFSLHYCVKSTQKVLALISFSSMSFTDPQKEIRGPVVEVLPPSEAELCKKKKKDNVTLLCVAKNFYPDHVYVSWEIDNDVKREKTKDVPIEKDGNYIISSRLRVPKKDWKSGKKFTCIVYYYNGTGYEPFQDSISGVRKPKVKVLPPSPKEPCWVRRNSVTLVCVATDFYPDHVTVSWKINGEKQSTGVGTGVAQRVNKSYSISSQLRVKMSTWQNPINTFSCSVIFYNGTHYIPRLGLKGTYLI
uniref:Ig-like domain-containing protein n=1 Tax=Denticeps clupeoides TaxID=299321 RepID=A0AAY4AEA7_9TELE